jgi:DNA-binding protein YbaB
MDPGAELSNGDEWIDSWLASVSTHTTQLRQLSDRVTAVSATAANADGTVQVTVSSTGVVTELRLDETVRRWPAEQIASEILAVMRDAQGQLATRVAQIAAQTVGAQSPTAQAMVADLRRRFPARGGGPAGAQRPGWATTNRTRR